MFIQPCLKNKGSNNIYSKIRMQTKSSRSNIQIELWINASSLALLIGTSQLPCMHIRSMIPTDIASTVKRSVSTVTRIFAILTHVQHTVSSPKRTQKLFNLLTNKYKEELEMADHVAQLETQFGKLTALRCTFEKAIKGAVLLPFWLDTTGFPS